MTTLFWVIDKPLVDVVTKEIDESILGKTVVEYWDGNGRLWGDFSESLPPEVLLKIIDIRIVKGLVIISFGHTLHLRVEEDTKGEGDGEGENLFFGSLGMTRFCRM